MTKPDLGKFGVVGRGATFTVTLPVAPLVTPAPEERAAL